MYGFFVGDVCNRIPDEKLNEVSLWYHEEPYKDLDFEEIIDLLIGGTEENNVWENIVKKAFSAAFSTPQPVLHPNTLNTLRGRRNMRK